MFFVENECLLVHIILKLEVDGWMIVIYISIFSKKISKKFVGNLTIFTIIANSEVLIIMVMVVFEFSFSSYITRLIFHEDVCNPFLILDSAITLNFRSRNDIEFFLH